MKCLLSGVADKNIANDMITNKKNNIWSKERDKVRRELMTCFEKHVSMLRQKSRFKWFLEGDRNSRLVNQFIQKRRNKNKICKVWWQGKCYSRPGDVRKVFFLHFKSIYNKKQNNIVSLGNLINNQISANESTELERKFSITEVEYALHSLGSDKAPGPDGFNNLYIKSSSLLSKIK